MTLAGLLEQQVRAVRTGVDALRLDLAAVHDVRVSVRRLRATLAVFGEVVEDVPARVPDDLRWFARQVGGTRDAEVVAERVEIRLGDVPDRPAAGVLAAALQQHAEEAEAVARAALVSPRTDDLLGALGSLHLGASGGDGEPFAERAHGAVLRSLDVLCVDLPAAIASVADPAVSGSRRARLLHAQRKQVKTVRAVTALLVTPPATRAGLNRSLRTVQDLLGEHHDAVVTRAWLARVAGQDRGVQDVVRMFRRHERAEMVLVEEQLPGAVARLLARTERVRRAPGTATGP